MKTLKYVCLILALYVLSGCFMTGNYGIIVIDKAATKAFESFQMDPGMNYYASGPEAYPDALIGLKKEYVLDNNLWKPVKPDSELFQRLIQSMQQRAFEQGESEYGFAMKDPQGRTVGIWYSWLKISKTIEMKDNNRVIVYTPELSVPKGRTGTYQGNY